MSILDHQGKYLICAGEPSGDLLARDVVVALKKMAPHLAAHGVTGRHMEAAGATPIARTDELMVMGFIDVVKKLPSLLAFEKRLVANAIRMQPAFVVLVDYPGLHLRVAQKLQSHGFPIFQLVAPQLWAWKEKRVFEWKTSVDMMLGVMPFEQDFFEKYGLNFKYVGTPQADRVRQLQIDHPWPPLAGVTSTKIGFFPGSRDGEFSRMAPAFLQTISALRGRQSFAYYMSIGQDISLDLVEKIFRAHGQGLRRDDIQGYEIYRSGDITLLRGHSLELMASVDAAVVTSGTATLECGLIGTPMCVAYKTSATNYAIAKRLVTLKDIALVNIVAGERIVEEFVQDLDPQTLAHELQLLASPGPHREQTKARLKRLHTRVTGYMGKNVARTILDFLEEKSS